MDKFRAMQVFVTATESGSFATAAAALELSPQMVARFPGWIAPIAAGGVAPPAAAQTVFQIQPMPAPGAQEYTVEIDGQQLRYRNTPAQWASMVHPSPQGVPGARITAVAFDGRSVEVFNEPGQFGLKRMIDTAAKQKRDGGVFELRWTSGGITVAMGLKIVSSPENSAADGAPPDQGYRGLRLPETVVGAPLAGATPSASPTPLMPTGGGPPVTAVAGAGPAAGGIPAAGALTGAVR